MTKTDKEKDAEDLENLRKTNDFKEQLRTFAEDLLDEELTEKDLHKLFREVFWLAKLSQRNRAWLMTGVGAFVIAAVVSVLGFLFNLKGIGGGTG